MYKIKGWNPSRENQMGGSGFSIVLTPQWKEAVLKSNLTQEKVDNFIKNTCVQYLKQHGFRETRIDDIRISWGEWGIEHITVPGNACGLDIDEHGICLNKGEVILTPHNVDTIFQASLILSIFLWFADYLEFSLID